MARKKPGEKSKLSGVLTVKRIKEQLANQEIDIDEAINRLLKGPVAKGTKSLRNQLFRLKGKIVNKTNACSDSITKITQAVAAGQGANLSGLSLDINNVLANLLENVTFVLDNKAPDSIGSVVEKHREILKGMKAFSGSYNDPTRKRLLDSEVLRRLPNDIRKDLKEGNLVSSDNFDEIELNKNLSVTECIEQSKERVKAMIEAFSAEISQYQPGDTFLGIPYEAFAEALDPAGEIEEGKEDSLILEDQASRKKYKREWKVIHHIYSYKTITEVVYTVVKISITLKPGPTLSEMIITDDTVSLNEEDRTLIAKAKQVIVPIKLPIHFLEKAKALTPNNTIILQWEHIISLATVNIQNSYILARQIASFGLEKDAEQQDKNLQDLPAVKQALKVADALQKILTVSQQVDSIFSSFTVDGINLIPPGTPSLGRDDIIKILNTHDINLTEYNWFYNDNGTLRSRKGATKRVVLSAEGGVPVYAAVDNVFGIWGVQETNQAKGVISGQLVKMALKAIGGDTEAALRDLAPFFFQGKSSDSMVETVVLDVLEQTLGPIKGKDPAKPKRKSGKVPGGKVWQRTEGAPPKIINVSKKKSSTPNITIKTGSSTENVKIKRKVPRARTSVLRLLRENIREEVRSLMVKPRLQNRTGRFANSVEVISANARGIKIQYMTNPFNYDIFSVERGRSPWATTARDPVGLISLAVRQILSRHKVSYAQTVSIGKQ